MSKGFSVVIGGYLHTEAWEELEKNTTISYRFMLNPSKETIKIRDSERDSKYYMGEEAIQKHIDYIGSGLFFKDFEKIDSSEQTVDETVNEIIEIITKSGSV